MDAGLAALSGFRAVPNVGMPGIQLAGTAVDDARGDAFLLLSRALLQDNPEINRFAEKSSVFTEEENLSVLWRDLIRFFVLSGSGGINLSFPRLKVISAGSAGGSPAIAVDGDLSGFLKAGAEPPAVYPDNLLPGGTVEHEKVVMPDIQMESK